jgi:hypothetical protein
MGLMRRAQGSNGWGCRCASLKTSNAKMTRNTHAPFGFRRHGGICSISVLALLDDVRRHRLRRAAWHLPPWRSERNAS